MKIKQKKNGTVSVTAGSGRREQAAMAQFMNAMCGRDPLPECETCGGITVEKGPTSGRCDCTPPGEVGQHREHGILVHEGVSPYTENPTN